MCGRGYQTYTEDELAARYLTDSLKRRPRLDFRPNYNLAPSQQAPIVYIKDDESQIMPMRWGLVPFWAADVKSADKYSLINAKSEEITTKRSYSAAFKKRRCIVPLSGFFEWKRVGDHKQPYAIFLKGDPIMSVAGIWEHWKSKDQSEEVYSFSILTTSANSFMKDIHLRMPVILNRSDEASWLDPATTDADALQKYLAPCSADIMDAYKITTLVNSPRNNSAEVLVRLI